MRVIGAGFGRTGTMSLKVALEQLGCGPCYHMLEVFDKPRHVELWQAAAEGRPVDWGELFAGYNSAVDWPACSFYKQLMDVYPEAKVLLTVRDPERWYESVTNTIYPSSREASPPPDRRAHLHMIETLIWQGTFAGRFEDKQHAIAVFERHNEEVKRHVPAGRLLVYEVQEGWEPLCRFLDVPVPEATPFPRLNDTAAFQQRVQERAQSIGRVS
jgi:sulfotransferase family protein